MSKDGKMLAFLMENFEKSLSVVIKIEKIRPFLRFVRDLCMKSYRH